MELEISAQSSIYNYKFITIISEMEKQISPKDRIKMILDAAAKIQYIERNEFQELASDPNPPQAIINLM